LRLDLASSFCTETSGKDLSLASDQASSSYFALDSRTSSTTTRATMRAATPELF